MSEKPPNIAQDQKDLLSNDDGMSEAMAYDGNFQLNKAKMAAKYFAGSCPTTDDPNTPALTIRVIILGTIWGIFFGCADTVFSFRSNHFTLPASLIKILVLPMGNLMARVLPHGLLNPGKFNIKEHVLVTIISTAAGGIPHGIDNIVMQHGRKYFADATVNIWNGMAWVAVTQLIGFGVSGFLIRILIKPAAMFWPQIISSVALFTALHGVNTDGDQCGRFKMPRLKFFWIVSGCFFIYHFIPSYFVTTLQSVAILCLITSNRTARFLGSGGSNSGVGIMAMTFDFTVGHGEHSIVNPWWTSANYIGSKVLWEWILVPICYYSNLWNQPKLQSSYRYPDGEDFGILNSLKIFNRNGTTIFVKHPAKNTSSIEYLLQNDFHLDIEKYERNKPFYLTEFNVISYFSRFISITASMTYIALWYGTDMVRFTMDAYNSKKSSKALNDIHNQLMSKYYELPEWKWGLWLLGWGIVTIIVTQTTPFRMPIWATLLSILIGILGSFINGFLRAISGARISNHLLSEIVIGHIAPGNTILMATFASLCRNIQIQSVELLGDLKLGHYLHIPPIAMITSQVYGVLIGVICNTSTAFYVIDYMKEPKIFEAQEWLATMYDAFVNNAGIWGAIGPRRFFGPDTPYSSLYYGEPNLITGFIIGVFIPIVPWMLNKWKPHHFWHLLNPALLFSSLDPGRIQSGIVYQFITAFVFQYYIFRNHNQWFNKYLYIMAAALSFGAGMCLVCIIAVLSLRPSAALPHSIFRPGTFDWYCFDGNPIDDGKGGISNHH